jgi:uncharacterized protein (DUF2267 family)
MSATGLEVFDTTLQKTNAWLADLMAELKIENRKAAYQTLRAVLHALRDRLTPEEVADLSAGMPMLVRGIFFEGWRPGRARAVERSQEAFLQQIQNGYDGRPYAAAKEMAEAVFVVLSCRIPAGEISDVRRMLPASIRDLWPQERSLA